ncbi:MAG: LapA family protein [Smithella sp.]|jgi:uncharacterized integral membrane protein|nr:LapA family protein [Smithella sp.]
MNIKVILFTIISCLAVVFIIQNVAAVTVNIFFWQVSLSIALLIFIIFAAGFAAGWFWRSFLAFRETKREAAEIQKNLRAQ